MNFELIANRSAVLVLDLQELFTSPTGPFENHLAKTLIDQVNDFCRYCQELNIPVIYSRYVLEDDLSDAGLLASNDIVREGYFCASSPWMTLDQRLQVVPGAIHHNRNRPGAFWNGSLAEKLVELQVDTLLLSGLSINNAISTTAREAFAHDIPSLVVKECCGAAPFETNMEQYFEILHTWTTEVANVDNIKLRLSS